MELEQSQGGQDVSDTILLALAYAACLLMGWFAAELCKPRKK